MQMNKEPGLVVSAGDIFREKAEIDISCTYHQHLHYVSQEGFVNSLNLRPWGP